MRERDRVSIIRLSLIDYSGVFSMSEYQIILIRRELADLVNGQLYNNQLIKRGNNEAKPSTSDFI